MPRPKRPHSYPSPPNTAHKSKKLKLLASYTTSSPFPNFPHPSPSEAHQIHALLSAQFALPPQGPPDPASNPAETCGAAPNVLDALLGTILSQHTSSKNAAAAKASLDAAFGRHAFAAIAQAPRAAVVAALQRGGLANKKAATIQGALAAVQARHGAYSLQHLAARGVSDGAAMRELLSYDGVGPKTAACVLMFCLGRAAFAVDTHVFRLCGVLGWVPPGADRGRAQAHLERRIPGGLKYGLHVGMVRHGRGCRGCGRAGEGGCVLRAYLEEKKRREE